MTGLIIGGGGPGSGLKFKKQLFRDNGCRKKTAQKFITHIFNHHQSIIVSRISMKNFIKVGRNMAKNVCQYMGVMANFGH